MSSKPRRIPALVAMASILISSVIGLGLAELGMRLVLARRTLMDLTDSDYWIVWLGERVRSGRNFEPDIVHDPLLGWRMRPGSFSAGVSVNQSGFRGTREYAVERAAGVRRIMLLGDSMFFGLGIKDQETLGAQLEKRLPGVEVLNASANGWGADQQYLYWMKEGQRFDPDIVIVGFYVDDYTRTSATCREYLKPRLEAEGDRLVVTQTPIPKPEDLPERGVPTFNGRLRVIELAQYVWQRTRWKLFGKYQSEERFQRSSKVVRLITKELRETTIDRGKHLLVAMIPSHLYEREFDATRIHNEVARILGEQKIPSLDLAPVLRKAETSEFSIYAEQTAHFTPRAVEVVADRLADYLRKEKLVE